MPDGMSPSYWRPRVAAMFGTLSDARIARLSAWGRRQQTSGQFHQAWDTALAAAHERVAQSATTLA